MRSRAFIVARVAWMPILFGQQEVAGVAGLAGDHVAAVSEFFYVFFEE